MNACKLRDAGACGDDLGRRAIPAVGRNRPELDQHQLLSPSKSKTHRLINWIRRCRSDGGAIPRAIRLVSVAICTDALRFKRQKSTHWHVATEALDALSGCGHVDPACNASAAARRSPVNWHSGARLSIALILRCSTTADVVSTGAPMQSFSCCPE
jgi:hypothetical protein